MRVDPKELPIPMQEQLASKILAQMPMAHVVAAQKVRVRKLCFPEIKDKWRYIYLRDMVRNGTICDLVLRLDDAGEYVRSFTYLVMEEL